MLRYYEAKNALVFCNTRAAVNHLTARFNNRGFSVVALSGELSQNERTHALQAMRDGRARVCIATDVAARGIDLPDLELVIHADLPTNPETLLHRSGRTGRAGRKGVSALIVPNNAAASAPSACCRMPGIKADMGKPAVGRRRHPARRRAPARRSDLQRASARMRNADFVGELLNTHGAEQVAAAFVRLYRASRSAPEDLRRPGRWHPSRRRTTSSRARDESARRARDDFGDSVWFSVSVGRKQNAEPRWLIPMLCRTGGITKREIGAIKMQPDETFVQIAADSADSVPAVDRSEQGARSAASVLRSLTARRISTGRQHPSLMPARRISTTVAMIVRRTATRKPTVAMQRPRMEPMTNGATASLGQRSRVSRSSKASQAMAAQSRSFRKRRADLAVRR